MDEVHNAKGHAPWLGAVPCHIIWSRSTKLDLYGVLDCAWKRRKRNHYASVRSCADREIVNRPCPRYPGGPVHVDQEGALPPLILSDGFYARTIFPSSASCCCPYLGLRRQRSPPCSDLNSLFIPPPSVPVSAAIASPLLSRSDFGQLTSVTIGCRRPQAPRAQPQGQGLQVPPDSDRVAYPPSGPLLQDCWRPASYLALRGCHRLHPCGISSCSS